MIRIYIPNARTDDGFTQRTYDCIQAHEETSSALHHFEDQGAMCKGNVEDRLLRARMEWLDGVEDLGRGTAAEEDCRDMEQENEKERTSERFAHQLQHICDVMARYPRSSTLD